MKAKLGLLIILFALVFTSCEFFETKIKDASISKMETGNANAEKINGVYIFIKSKPVQEYECLGEYEITWFEQTDKFLHMKGKKIGEALSDLTQTANYNKKIEMMIGSVKAKYPETEGIIFRQNLLTCDAIKFK